MKKELSVIAAKAIFLAFIFITLFSVDSKAVEYDAGIKVIALKQELFGTIEFNQPVLSATGTLWLDNGLGLSTTIGKSTEVDNSKHIEGLDYTNKITLLTSYSILYKHELFENFDVYIEGGLTDYRSLWTVNDEYPLWSKSVDSDYHYGGGFRYSVDNVVISIGYLDYYRHYKKGYGQENTTGYSLSITTVF